MESSSVKKSKVVHSFVCYNEGCIERLYSAVEPLGYRITQKDFEVVDGIKHWSFRVMSVNPLSVPQRTDHENRISKISLKHGVEYSGWHAE